MLWRRRLICGVVWCGELEGGVGVFEDGLIGLFAEADGLAGYLVDCAVLVKLVLALDAPAVALYGGGEV